MIKIKNTVCPSPEQWEATIRGMRNPLESYDKMDSKLTYKMSALGYEEPPEFIFGDNDFKLALKLAKAGSEHSKYRRFLNVIVDVTAPLYWWKEADTYKVGLQSNSTSTMHKLGSRLLTICDFSCEYLDEKASIFLGNTVEIINNYIEQFQTETDNDKKKDLWYQIIQLLPSSYNQKRTIVVNYETLANIYRQRKGHKLTEWQEFCEWIKSLPYSELITGVENV